MKNADLIIILERMKSHHVGIRDSLLLTIINETPIQWDDGISTEERVLREEDAIKALDQNILRLHSSK